MSVCSRSGVHAGAELDVDGVGAALDGGEPPDPPVGVGCETGGIPAEDVGGMLCGVPT